MKKKRERIMIDNNMFNVNDHVVIITGGAGEIGLSIVHTLVSAGALVAILDFNLEPIREVFFENDRVKLYKCDVTNERRVTEVVKEIQNHWGRIDVLITAAAVIEDEKMSGTNVTSYSTSEFSHILNVNVNGAFIISKQVSKVMMKQKSGSIIYLSSIFGKVGEFSGKIGYCVSKGAIEQLTKSLAVQLGDYNIRVNNVAPGFIDTKFFSREINGKNKMILSELKRRTPLRKLGTVQDLQGILLFLSSDSSSFCTGSSFVIDGGWVAQ
ncbi:SDR family NAD(P)-dependent oxidoreductase [Rossellomorea sp. LjRoot5]|uniref:SDR family NAD(P)-dependent oxidoreductase n=1 Tax=Rossellomorea sp. LjRoot5 TaxID=3342331 RepID=UPI003ECF8515